jgi:hypothetical protein
LTRCIANGNLRGAEMAARELGRLSLDDALQLCVLLREQVARCRESNALRE